METSEARQVIDDVVETVEEAVVARRSFLETVLVGVLARRHVLLEDVPGTGKTLTARSLASALGLEFSRIQFTPDLLPSDITGSNVFDEGNRRFEFVEGPVFANVVLADEINRAPPKTQAALLEAMEEGQVTVDGETHDLPTPFFVMATQNPVESEGTFRLPEAQLDRFILKESIGYPDFDGALELIDRRADRTEKAPTVSPVLDGRLVRKLQGVPERVRVENELREHIVELGRETRADERVEVGVSPRGIQQLFEAARVRAVVRGREYVVPDDIHSMVHPVFRHRLVLTPQAKVRDTDPDVVLDDVRSRVEVPGVAPS